MPKPQNPRTKNLKKFDQALTSIADNEYRRMSGPYYTLRGDVYNVSIYRCANGIIRADFHPRSEGSNEK